MLKCRSGTLLLIKRLALTSFILICFAGIGSATDYYVSNGGSNSNSGLSIDNAWKTPSYAVTKVTAGDTIYLDGTWLDEKIDFKVSGQPGKPITLTALKGATPVIYTDNGHGAWGGNENGYFGIKIKGRHDINISGITMGGYRADVWIGDSDRIHVSNMDLGNYKGYDSQFACMMYYDVHDSSFTKSVCEGSYHDTVCVWGHTFNNNPSIPHATSNILVDGNTVKDSTTHNLIDLNEDVYNIVISNNKLSDKDDTAVWMHTYDEIYSGITIKNNNFEGCYRDIRPINTTNLQIVGNTFTGTGTGGTIRMYGQYNDDPDCYNRNVYIAGNNFDESMSIQSIRKGRFEYNTLRSGEYCNFKNCEDVTVVSKTTADFGIRKSSDCSITVT